MNKKTDTDLTYQRRPRTSGFRFFIGDIFILVSGIAVPLLTWRLIGACSLLVPFVVGHFFLFCNIFRVRRKLELIWAAIFLINTFTWSIIGNLYVPGIFGIQIIATLVIIICEVRSPLYHSVFARKVNPKLDEYLNG